MRCIYQLKASFIFFFILNNACWKHTQEYLRYTQFILEANRLLPAAVLWIVK